MNTVTDSVTPVYDPNEIQEAQKRLSEIRFDCLVKMYDIGYAEKSNLPQVFRQYMTLSLNFIKNSDEYTIGRAIKDGYLKLMEHISDYEKKS